MPIAALIAALALQAGDGGAITVTGRPWAPFISPMGEPFRPRPDNDDTLAAWFRKADRDGDGTLTAAEMTADAERFFATLDSDRNGAIHPAEFVSYEWEVAPEIQVNSRWRRARGEPVPDEPPAYDRSGRATMRTSTGYDSYALQGAARYALLNIPQPVAAADADFDRSVTLDEFRAAAVQRFALLDRQGDGGLTLAELQALRLDPREARRKRRPGKDEADTRIGTPLPAGD